MGTVYYQFQAELEVTFQADVVVVGGGPGGIGAAVTAARAGASVLLIERYGCLGGMAGAGEVQPFMANHHRRPGVGGGGEEYVCMDRPVYRDWVKRIIRYLPECLQERARGDEEIMTVTSRTISKDAAALAAEELCLDAGVKILYHHWLADVLLEGRLISALILHSKSGFTAVQGQTYIDCSGDGDLAARAGCHFEMGGPSGHCQPMTTCFKLSGVDRSKIPDRSALNRLYDSARERGMVNCLRENVLNFHYYDDDVVHFNTTRVIHKSGVNGAQLSEAEMDGHRQVREYLFWLRCEVPGFENASLHSMGAHIGVRETRRIRGRAYLTMDDYEKREKFADAICRCNYPVDIHNPDGSGTDCRHIDAGEYYEIPFGCLVAADVDNLCIGGRPISVDHGVHSSMRVMPPACSIGSAAGMASAMAVAQGCRVSSLDGRAVRQRLAEQGAYL